MPRMDNGDAFDRILQRWLENSTEDMHDQGLQKENQRQRGTFLENSVVIALR